MLVPIGIAASSVAAGALLGLLPVARDRALNPIRTFALTASLAVVIVHLLPESFEAIGGFSLLVFLAALVLPSALHAALDIFALRRVRYDRSVFAIEVAYAGLLLHQFADGISLGTYGGSRGSGQAHPDVLVAIGAHTVPVVAFLVLGMAETYGVPAALVRAALLLASTSLGVIGTELVPARHLEAATAWIAAGAAGLLLHVVTHGRASSPSGPRSRAADLAAAVLGIGVSFLGSHGSHELMSEAAEVRRALGTAISDLWLDAAPALALGVITSAAAWVCLSRIPRSRLNAPRSVREARSGWLLALEHPLGLSRAPRVTSALRGLALSPAFVFAFLAFVPELGLSTLAISVRFFGWRFALLRACGAVVAALIAALAMTRMPANSEGTPERGQPDVRASNAPAPGPGFITALDDTITQAGAWLGLGLLAAAFTETLFPTLDRAALTSPLTQIFVVTVLLLPSYVCSPVAVLVGAVLVARGLPPGALLGCLVLGPALNALTIAVARTGRVSGVSLASMLGAALVSAGLSIALDRLHVPVQLHAHEGAEVHAYPWPAYVAAFALAAFAIRGIWRVGASTWLASLWRSEELPRVHAQPGAFADVLAMSGASQVQASHNPRT